MAKQCIYCRKYEGTVTFKSEEHIIPQSLGGQKFPAISDAVCDNCNSVIFSQLETIFKQDSLEGIEAQMLGLGNSQSVWIRGKNLNMKTVTGFGEKFFNEMFPFLKFQDGVAVIDLRPQLKVRNKNSGFQVFPLDYLEKVKTGSQREFEKLKERLSKTSEKDIAIFTGSSDGTTKSIDDFIALLSDYKITYKEKGRFYIPKEQIEGNGLLLNWEGTIDSNLMRVIAKIAFNYFIYCSIQEGEDYKNLLFKKDFDPIRNFIRNGDGNWKEFVTLTKKQSIVGIENAIIHSIAFYFDGDKIVANITLFGSQIYKVNIGSYPSTIIASNFGCGHAFEPFSNTISAISPNQFSLNRLMDDGFGWFKL